MLSNILSVSLKCIMTLAKNTSTFDDTAKRESANDAKHHAFHINDFFTACVDIQESHQQLSSQISFWITLIGKIYFNSHAMIAIIKIGHEINSSIKIIENKTKIVIDNHKKRTHAIKFNKY